MREILLKDQCVSLGIQGEANVARVVMDISDMARSMPGGTAALLVLRPDGKLYPAPCEYDAETRRVSHTLSGADMACQGIVKFEVQWMDGGRIAKSGAFFGYVTKSLGDPAEPPEEPAHTWVQSVSLAARSLPRCSASDAGAILTVSEDGGIVPKKLNVWTGGVY